MTEPLDPRAPRAADATVPLGHLVRTLHKYLRVIILSMLAVMIGYTIIALVIFLFSPSQNVTSQSFRLEFKGSDRGEYPNGLKFSTTEIISTPVLLQVYRQNDLKRFMNFIDFSRSIFVLESNAAYEALTREYQARLSDPRLTAVDRERIQKEFDLKQASVAKGQYSVNHLQTEQRPIPRALVRKVLVDILREWANFATQQQHVLEYRVSVVSPELLVAQTADDDPLIATNLLLAKVMRVLNNIDEIGTLPAVELARTKDGLTLDDIRMRLEDIARFKLEPLVTRIAESGLLPDRERTLRFVETQLAHDERVLEAQKQKAAAARSAIMVYSSRDAQPEPTSAGEGTQRPGRESETVMPQITESFIDRLLDLTSSIADTQYRQRVAEDYRQLALDIVPMEQAVAYDRFLLGLLGKTSGRSTSLTKDAANQQIEASRREVHALVLKLHEIYRGVSRNLNPATQLVSMTAPPVTRIERSVSVKRLLLYGILLCLIALPIIIVFCLLHNRVREEHEVEAAYALEEAIEPPAVVPQSSMIDRR